MARAFLFILDSFGIGGAPDAKAFDDLGSNTLGHIAKACFEGKCDKAGVRAGKLNLPNMEALGLGLAAKNACGQLPMGFLNAPKINGFWASAQEVSKGKDTPSGHWEIAGVPVTTDWGYFPKTEPTFPKELMDEILSASDVDGILGNRHASGTQIISELGEEHLKTGKPICYTSADSVFQIAAHEQSFGLERLYAFCENVFNITKGMNIGRVIARPFEGDSAENFIRTGNRKDYSIKPPQPTLLDMTKANGREMIAIGKIADIYAHCGPTKIVKANGNKALGDATLKEMKTAPEGSFLMTNFVDFDSLYGHRRDVFGYAKALEDFDVFLPQLMDAMKEDDLMIISADHGCDPTWVGTEHTREQVPVLAYSPSMASGTIKTGTGGTRTSFCDIGATIAEHLKIESLKNGTSIFGNPQ
ncbi:MAG: phosphopentomutase [Nitratireductor sp.]